MWCMRQFVIIDCNGEVYEKDVGNRDLADIGLTTWQSCTDDKLRSTGPLVLS